MKAALLEKVVALTREVYSLSEQVAARREMLEELQLQRASDLAGAIRDSRDTIYELTKAFDRLPEAAEAEGRAVIDAAIEDARGRADAVVRDMNVSRSEMARVCGEADHMRSETSALTARLMALKQQYVEYQGAASRVVCGQWVRERLRNRLAERVVAANRAFNELMLLVSERRAAANREFEMAYHEVDGEGSRAEAERRLQQAADAIGSDMSEMAERRSQLTGEVQNICNMAQRLERLRALRGEVGARPYAVVRAELERIMADDRHPTARRQLDPRKAAILKRPR